jgi:hypothetical protein
MTEQKSNIRQFKVISNESVSEDTDEVAVPNQVLTNAMDELTMCLVIGRHIDGSHYCSGSTDDKGALLLLIKTFETNLLMGTFD